LHHLNVSNININESLEYLPENIEEFYCKNCSNLKHALKEFVINEEEGRYDLKE
jgi:hypothetical protein